VKIFVIGRTHRIRLETIESLRQLGHQAELPLPKPCFYGPGEASRDPGYAGRHLRALLEHGGMFIRNQWLSRGARAAQFRQLLGIRGAHGSAKEASQSGRRRHHQTTTANTNPAGE
jgi:hypothetical protein